MYLNDSLSGKKCKLLALSRSATPSTVCTTVRSILQNCLQFSMTTLHYDGKKLLPKFCLSCPDGDCVDGDCVDMHEVKCGEKQTYALFCETFKPNMQFPQMYCTSLIKVRVIFLYSSESECSLAIKYCCIFV